MGNSTIATDFEDILLCFEAIHKCKIDVPMIVKLGFYIIYWKR